MADNENGSSIPVLEHGRVKRGPRAKSRSAAPRTKTVRTAEAASGQGVQGTEASFHAADEVSKGRIVEEPHEITRKSRGERSVDRFAIPPGWKKRGWDYQFWVRTVLGQPVEGTTEIWEGGWRPVYWRDVPQPWAPGAQADQQIERGGQLLFLRPMELTQQARQEEYAAAEQQKRDRIQSALEGKVSGHEGIADIKGVRPVGMSLTVEGEVGTQSGHTPTR